MNGIICLFDLVAGGDAVNLNPVIAAILAAFNLGQLNCESLHRGSLYRGSLYLAQVRLLTLNWLWVAGAIVTVWVLISAMARRQTRLTGVLKDHVERHKKASKPPEVDENAEGGSE